MPSGVEWRGLQLVCHRNTFDIAPLPSGVEWRGLQLLGDGNAFDIAPLPSSVGGGWCTKLGCLAACEGSVNKTDKNQAEGYEGESDAAANR